jgi:hypothetical protein
MPGDPDWAGGDVFQDSRERVVQASAQHVFDVLTRLGGRQGWFRYNGLWRLRGFLDRVSGGRGGSAEDATRLASRGAKPSTSGGSWSSTAIAA